MSSLSTAGRALSSARRRSLWGLVAAALTIIGVLAIPAQPAAAGGVYVAISASEWAYTDSREPYALVRNGAGDVAVGSWRDAGGKHHKSRSYFTFDLTRFHGARILWAEGFLSESRVENCEADRAIEVWRTDPVTESSNWREPPAERERLYSIGTGNVQCPASYLDFAVVEALREAVSAKQDTLTLAVRVPDDLEGDPNLGRWLKNKLYLSIKYNTPPRTPTDLRIYPDVACATESPGPYVGTPPRLMARFSDPEESDRMTGEFTTWPADQPGSRTDVTDPYVINPGTASVDLAADLLADGKTYGWAVRAKDDYDVSGWSETCYFTVDTTAPAMAPTITGAAEYPENEWSGAPGIPGTFTFSANGESDVVGYRYAWLGHPHLYVEADELGGSASVTYVPDSSGPRTLSVQSVDRAGNRSPISRYEFGVDENRPYVSVNTYPVEPGVPVEVTFHPRMENVVSYTYKIDSGPEQTVAAGEDGTATVELTFDEPGFYRLYIRSTDASGYTTLYDYRSIYVEEPWDDGGWDW